MGNSLTATRVVRTLYATHNGVEKSRFLGGSFGTLDGALGASHLLQAETLGQYVDWLDKNGVCGPTTGKEEQEGSASPEASLEEPGIGADHAMPTESTRSYKALLEAIMKELSVIACGLLLDSGVDPNTGAHGGRLSKVSSQLERKKRFNSNPLHLACSKRLPFVVRNLLQKGCNHLLHCMIL